MGLIIKIDMGIDYYLRYIICIIRLLFEVYYLYIMYFIMVDIIRKIIKDRVIGSRILGGFVKENLIFVMVVNVVLFKFY